MKSQYSPLSIVTDQLGEEFDNEVIPIDDLPDVIISRMNSMSEESFLLRDKLMHISEQYKFELKSFSGAVANINNPDMDPGFQIVDIDGVFKRIIAKLSESKIEVPENIEIQTKKIVIKLNKLYNQNRYHMDQLRDLGHHVAGFRRKDGWLFNTGAKQSSFE